VPCRSACPEPFSPLAARDAASFLETDSDSDSDPDPDSDPDSDSDSDSDSDPDSDSVYLSPQVAHPFDTTVVCCDGQSRT
jgi:hypothetical protein